ncbi:hypothetical protein Q3G72_004728 [Acer saccharum]|nr:hypothetical protein Q3G72_004728 [Acer saccharum]
MAEKRFKFIIVGGGVYAGYTARLLRSLPTRVLIQGSWQLSPKSSQFDLQWRDINMKGYTTRLLGSLLSGVLS